MIERVLPRRSACSARRRRRAHREQMIAANIDVVFVVCGLDGDFNPRRIERYLVLVIGSGARPVVVLTKADRCDERRRAAREVERRRGPASPVLRGQRQGSATRRRVARRTWASAAPWCWSAPPVRASRP